jgi:hypothetical protein
VWLVWRNIFLEIHGELWPTWSLFVSADVIFSEYGGWPVEAAENSASEYWVLYLTDSL